MTLDELAVYINDNTIVEIYSASTYEVIGEYDGKESVPDNFLFCNVTDIFVEGNKLCIEIEED